MGEGRPGNGYRAKAAFMPLLSRNTDSTVSARKHCKSRLRAAFALLAAIAKSTCATAPRVKCVWSAKIDQPALRPRPRAGVCQRLVRLKNGGPSRNHAFGQHPERGLLSVFAIKGQAGGAGYSSAATPLKRSPGCSPSISQRQSGASSVPSASIPTRCTSSRTNKA